MGRISARPKADSPCISSRRKTRKREGAWNWCSSSVLRAARFGFDSRRLHPAFSFFAYAPRYPDRMHSVRPDNTHGMLTVLPSARLG